MDLYSLMILIWHYFLRNQRYIKKFDYDGKRSQDRINLLSMTLIGVNEPFCIKDFLSICLMRSYEIDNILSKFTNIVNFDNISSIS